MAGSTYSTNLKIELMTTGENSGTWGDVTNTNLGTALEQAVVGYGNPDYVSDANLTISITNSNAAQAARALVLNVTSVFGSLTQTRELVVPTIQKQYIVQNNTTGGQSITVKTSAGTGITVPNGRKAHLYVDGTNVIQMFDYVDINGGSIDGTPIGASSASTGAFTTLNASGATTLDGNVTLGNASGDTVTVTGTISSNLLFTDNTYDIGASGATRPRNLYLAGAATIGGNLSVGGTLTLTGGLTLNGNVTVGDSASDTLTINSTVTSNLIFTDNTYDIGASGATRPRNLFIAGNITAGGNQTLTGSLTVDSTTDSSSTTTGSIQTDGGVGIAKSLYVGGSATVAGNTVLGDATSDYLQVNGYMGVGGSPSPSAAIYITSTDLTSGYQVGINSAPTGNSSATAGVFSFYGNPKTAASSFTSGQVVGFYAEDVTKGAGSTITSQYGVYVNDQTKGTNNFGVASTVSAGSNKWNIYASGSAPNYFNGSVGVGTVSPSAVLELYSTSNIGMFITRDNVGAGGGTYLGFREKNAAGSMLNQNKFDSYWGVATTGNEQSILILSQYRYGSTGEVLRVQNGNVGMGVTPSGWSSSYRALQIGSTALWSAPTGAYAQSYYTNNLYYDGSTYRYQYDGAGASYAQNQGGHQWLYASTGTANASASVASLMFLDTSARLYVNAISYPWIADFPNVKMYVAGEFATSQGGHIWFGDTTTASPCGIGEGLYNSFGSDSDFLTVYYRSSLRWYTGTTEVARATNDGDFLLGTTTLTSAISGDETTLTIRGRSTSYAGGLTVVNNAGTVVGAFAAGSAVAHAYFGTTTNNNVILLANNAEVGQITSDGSLIMGDGASGSRSGYPTKLGGYRNEPSGTPACIQAVTRGGAYSAGYISASNPGFDWQFGKGAQTGTSTNFEWGTNGGGGTVLLSLTSGGNLTVHGSLSKGSGSFVIDHPLPAMEETHHLVHSFIEGPQADLIYRGRVNLVNGRAEVNIDTASSMTDGTFVLLCRDVQCYTSNESDWIHVRGFVTGNILTIEAQDPTATSSISWMVIGERQDKHMLKTEWTDDTGKIIVEPTKASRLYDPTKDPMNPECPDYDPTLKPIL